MIVLSVHYVSSEVANWCKSNNFCIHLCQKLGDSIRKSIFYVCISDKFINFVALVFRKPQWAEVGQAYIWQRRFCTLWF